ncbi:thioesterase II family protein [Dyadobacter diqingensis]|uniref:thioesterase II family protein n=1 Tax=Dyadobacter diqingensis TaxID=2938121 RepID=UPI0020C26AAE|nr:thioesterase domain-containing protein [Dyadobacter diqingensis]
MDKITLFCLPFGGGNKFSYRAFQKYFPPFIKVINLEYPGRGGRIGEACLKQSDLLVNDLYDCITDKIDLGKYAIYGHSLGGLLAYLLTRKIIEQKRNPPLYLFVTGTSGPSALSRVNSRKFLLPKIDFINEINNYGGSSVEILENADLMDYFEPILRADFQVSETYVYKKEPILDIPITVITGLGEDMEDKDIKSWQRETSLRVEFLSMPGKHFFIFEYAKDITEIIAKRLLTFTNTSNVK